MNLETVLVIPTLFVIANRLHRNSGRPLYAGRICLALAAAAGLAALTTWAALDALDRAELPDLGGDFS